MPAPKDREKALEAALSQIDRQFGKGSIMRLGDDGRAPVEVIPTGSIALDVALGIGGLPRGRVVEIYGPESSGKTTLALHAVANAQKAGGIAAFIDAEHALDPEYAKKLGVDTDALLVSQPDTGEQALEIMDMLIRSGAIDVIVVDSVAALVPKAEIEGEMGDSHVGLQARLMSQALRKITGALNSSGTTAIFINQLREKIGVMFGSPETTTGGKALKFYASVRLDIRRIETLKEGTEAVGNRTRVKVVKNKMAPPFKQAEFDILYGVGISREGSLIDMGVEHGFVRKSGAWYTYEGDQLGQGKENARGFLRDNPDLAIELDKKIKEKLGIGARVDAPADARAGRGLLSSRMTSSTRRRGRFGTEPPPTGAAAQDAEPDQEAVARAIALRLLTASPRSRAQLAEAMARKDVPDEVAQRVLDRFTEVGLIDDVEYARMIVRTRHTERGLSRRAIAVELRRRGIDDEVAGDALGAGRRGRRGVGGADARATQARLDLGHWTRRRGRGGRSRRSDAAATHRDSWHGSCARSSRRPGPDSRRLPGRVRTGTVTFRTHGTHRSRPVPVSPNGGCCARQWPLPAHRPRCATCGRTRRTLWTQAPSARSSGSSAPVSWPSCSSSWPAGRRACSVPVRRRTSPRSRTPRARCARTSNGASSG